MSRYFKLFFKLGDLRVMIFLRLTYDRSSIALLTPYLLLAAKIALTAPTGCFVRPTTKWTSYSSGMLARRPKSFDRLDEFSKCTLGNFSFAALLSLMLSSLTLLLFGFTFPISKSSFSSVKLLMSGSGVIKNKVTFGIVGKNVLLLFWWYKTEGFYSYNKRFFFTRVATEIFSTNVTKDFLPL